MDILLPIKPKFAESIIFPDFVPPQSFCYIEFAAISKECNREPERIVS